jgi:hypothetical protein
LRNLGQVQDGIPLLERALKTFRGDVVVELFAALLLSKVGRDGEAIRLLALSVLRESNAPDLARYRDVLRRRFAAPAKSQRARRAG